MTRTVNARTLELVKSFEGFRSKAYLCPAGVWTCGWGHTGPEVVEGTTCTQRQGEVWLKLDLANAGRRISARIGPVVDELTDNQYGALCSFVFNLGAGDWTIWKKLKARDFDAVPAQMARFVNAGGKKLAGLVRRRNAEIELWSADEPGSADDEIPSSGALRAMDTPPAPAEKPKASPVITAAVGACAGVPVAAQQVMAVVSPYADKSEHIAKVIALVATIAAAASVALLVLQWLQRRNAKR